MTKTIRLTQALAAEYNHLFDTCSIQPLHRAAVVRLAEQLTEQQPRYAAVAQLTDIPWQVIAVIHALEASQRFDRHLHNGDPLHSRTVHVPKHRPLTRPPFTWEASAIDALHYSGLAKWRNWSIAGTLFKFESYNGWGYRRYHPQVLSPYLWSFSQHYQRGKYAADGQFDAQLISQQCGAAVLLKQLNVFTPAQVPAAPHSQQPNTAPLLPYPNTTIKRSTRYNAHVISIQQRLNALGYQPTLHTDGYFGPKTEQTVKWLQAQSAIAEQALQVDGVVGAQTWAVLFGAE